MVTKLSWDTPVRTLLHQCGWLSVQQLVHYHSLMLVYKMKLQGKPEYFQERFSSEFPYSTRLATGLGIRRVENIQYEASKSSFVPRTSRIWNLLPLQLRTARNEKQFKAKLKPWILDNIPV